MVCDIVGFILFFLIANKQGIISAGCLWTLGYIMISGGIFGPECCDQRGGIMRAWFFAFCRFKNKDEYISSHILLKFIFIYINNICLKWIMKKEKSILDYETKI